jgi:SAM-dependent methyltransferase
MSTPSPIDLIFGGMDKLAPGDDTHTLQVLRLLPRGDRRVIVDAGCGTGRQTMVLARALRTAIDAVDSHEPFLAHLRRRAAVAGLGHFVRVHRLDMKDIPQAFPSIDLLWSEGAAYSIGFANALSTWAGAIRPGGFLVASELSWLRDARPAAARAFFASEYPDMQSDERNLVAAERAGYRVVATHVLPTETWVDGYYDVLEPRAKALLDHADPVVRGLAAGALEEIRVFGSSEDSYGYVFYVLQREGGSG